MHENPNLESYLVNTLSKIMEKLKLESNTDRCTLVCDTLTQDHPSLWKVQRVSKKFDDFSDLVDGKALTVHAFLIIGIGKKYFLVDPTFGQFTGKKEIFVSEITGNYKNNCLKKLQKYNLPQKILHFYVNEIVKY